MGLHRVTFGGVLGSQNSENGVLRRGGWYAAAMGLVLFLWAAPAIAASENSLPSYLVEQWGNLTETLSDALSLRDGQETLPDSAWFGADKSSNAKKIDDLLDKALEILVQGQAEDLRRQAVALRAEIPELRLEADALRNQRISAPETSRLPWVKTRSKIDARLSELDGEITGRERALSAVNAQLAEALRGLGLQLDDRQIDVLLSSVTGDDLLQNAVVFANVRLMVEKLAELSREDRENLEINRRYSGLYLVLNDLLIHTQEELVRKIDGEYKPRLSEIEREAETLRKEALDKAAQAGYSEAQKKSFALNAESNAMTLCVAGLYVQLLDAQRKGILDHLAALRRNRDLAENTYRTVRSSGDLRNLIRSGLELFDSIHALSMPEMLPFENETIRREFEEINKRLKR